MDYKQKYKDALTWVESIYPELNHEHQMEAEAFFPELKGNEYESTRKRIISLVNAHGQGRFKESMLAWLEKQGQKPAEWKQENREELTEFENAMMHIGGSFFGENAGLDPNDTAIIKEQAELLLELASKTEWSEEDDSMFQSCIGAVATNDYYKGEEKEQIYDWLKSLKQRLK